MQSHRRFGAGLLVGTLALTGPVAASQEGRGLVLRIADVTTSGERLVLSTADGESYELGAVQTPADCPAADGGTWPCGEGARQALAAAVAGEQLECRILENGEPPAVECRAQTRNLNVWMLQIGRAALQPGWRGRISEYDEAESAARAAGALRWYDAEGETASPQSPAGSGDPSGAGTGVGDTAADSAGTGGFLLRRQEGKVRTYVLASTADAELPPLDYIDYEVDLSVSSPRTGFPLDDDDVPALATGEFIVHETNGGRFAYAQASPADDLVPLAYLVDAAEPPGRRYTRIVLDDVAWTARRGNLQPARTPLGTQVERRGATTAERAAVGAELLRNPLRAGVWTLGAFRVVVAEDPLGCDRSTWCRFAVLDDAGAVVAGTAREAPELVILNDGVAATAGREPHLTGLVWEAPGGAWMLWTP